MYEHNALGYWSGLALCLTKVRSSRARCPATALISASFRHNVSDVARCHTLRFTVRDVIYLFIYIPEEAKMAKRWVK